MSEGLTKIMRAVSEALCSSGKLLGLVRVRVFPGKGKERL